MGQSAKHGLMAEAGRDRHEGYPNHAQANHYDVLPLVLRKGVLISIFFRIMAIDGHLAGHHARRGL